MNSGEEARTHQRRLAGATRTDNGDKAVVLQLMEHGGDLRFSPEKERLIFRLKRTKTRIRHRQSLGWSVHAAVFLTSAKNSSRLIGWSPRIRCSFNGRERNKKAHFGGGGGQYTSATGGILSGFFSLI